MNVIPKWVRKFGKYALIVYVAYNVVELTIVLVFFPEFIPNLLQGKVTGL